jgi:putative ABC transport system permease protein
MRITQTLEKLRQDVRFALRQLRRSPAFTAISTATLALGIGANSAIFALVDATLLRPLPYRDAERLVVLWEQTTSSNRIYAAPLNLRDWNDQSRTFESMGGYVPGVGGMVMNGTDGAAETVSRQWVRSGFFDVLGAKPLVGRTFRPEDERQHANVVVLSEPFWRMRFNGDPSVVGGPVRLDGEQYTIVGVVPKEFQLLPTSIWALDSTESRSFAMLQVIGRLKPDVTIETAAVDMAAVAAGLAATYPQTNSGRGVRLQPLHEALIGGELRVTAMMFLGVVGFVLLICCANVANLLLARATGRVRELAMRTALGASRARIVRQLVTESVVLAMLGGVLGIAVGAAILRAAPSVIPEGLLPAAIALTFDLRVVAFCAAAALVVGVMFGVAPAARVTNLSSARALAAESRTSTGRGGRLRGFLVAGEVAMAVVLLFGAGLLLRTLSAVDNVDRGYRADSALTMLVDPLGSRYPTRESLQQFYAAIEQEVLAVPGVQSVGFASTLPLGPSQFGSVSFEIVGDAPVTESKRPTADIQIVSASYFTTLDLPVVAGRPFNDRDTGNVTPVCIVNEALARRYLQGRSPIGVQIALRSSRSAEPLIKEIVGVARQVKGKPDERDDLVQLYVPLVQNPVDDIYLLVRPASGRAEALAPSVRAAIGQVDKEQLVSVRDVMTLDDVRRDATGRHRFRAVLVTTFAALALVLALIGVFGILVYTVQQRARDFAVRRALGATSRDVVALVVRSGAWMVLSGAVIGLVLSAAFSRLVTTMLFGVQALDPLTFATVTIVVAMTSALSIAVPAWRASGMDPAAVLHGD